MNLLMTITSCVATIVVAVLAIFLICKKEAERADLTSRLREWLGTDGISFFHSVREKYGTLNACWIEEEHDDVKNATGLARAAKIAQHGRGIPHPVHFREGMQIRNWLRKQPETKGWTDYDYDDKWEGLVLKAISPCGSKGENK